MSTLNLTHDLNCPPDRYWKLFLDPDWNRASLLEGLGFVSCETLRFEKVGSVQHRHTLIEPKLDLPDLVRRALGSRLLYTEKGTFDDADRTWRWVITLDALGDKVRLSGHTRVEPLGADRCRRQSFVSIEVSMFGVGGAVDRAASANLVRDWDRSAAWMNGYLAKNPT